MKRGQLPQGYTIIEVMIFLAITGVLLVSALGVFSGQQDRTRFRQTLREMDSQIRAAATEVESGYYPNVTTFQCTLPGGTPTLSAGTTQQGANENCTFMGKSIQFGLNGASCTTSVRTQCTRYATHTIIGRRVDTNGQQVQSLQDPDGAGTLRGVVPRLAVGTINLADRKDIPGGLGIYRMYEMRGNNIVDIGSVGFIYSLADYVSGGSSPISGSQGVDLVTIPGSSLGQTETEESLDVINLNEANRNPDSIVICFREAGATSGKSGAIILGTQQRRLATEVSYDTRISPVPGNGC